MHERRTNDFNTHKIRHVFVNMTGDQYEINRNVNISKSPGVSHVKPGGRARSVTGPARPRKTWKHALAGTESPRARTVRGKMQTTPKNRTTGVDVDTYESPAPRCVDEHARPDREPASSGFILSRAAESLKPSLTTPSPAPRVPLPAQLRSDAKGRRLSSMLTAGFSLLKSLGKSATKRKRDGDEESPGDPETDSATKRARMPSAVGNPAGASFITSSVRKTKGKSSAPATDSVPTDLRDRFQSVDEEPPTRRVHPPAVTARRAPAHPQRRHGRAFLPDVLLLRRRVQVEVESEDEDIRDSLGSGAESRGGGSASGERGGVEGRSGRDVSKAGDDRRRLRANAAVSSTRGAPRDPSPPSSDEDLSDDDRPIARLARRPARRATRLRRDPTRRLLAASAGNAPRQSRTASGRRRCT